MAAKSYIGKMAKILFSLIAALILFVALIFFYIATPYFTATAGSWLTNRSGRNIELEGKVETHLWSLEPRFILHGVKVGNAEWGSEPTMFSADKIEFSVELLKLFRGRFVLPELIIEKPDLLLEKNKDGAANWNITQNAQAALVKQPLPDKRTEIPVINSLKIMDGKLAYNDPVKNIETKMTISTVSGQADEGEQIHLSGKGSYQKQNFALDITGASILQLNESESPYPFSLKATIGPTSASVTGTVQDPVKLNAMDVTLKLKGASASHLFPITGIALPPTPPYNVEGHLIHENGDWHFEKFSGRMGNSDLKGDVHWYPDQSPPYMKGDFTSDNLDMADLSGFIGAKNEPEDDGRVIPDTPLDISRLIAMNADVVFQGKHIKAPELLDNFSMKVNLKNGVLNLKPLSFGLAGGSISSNVTIEGKKEPPVATMDVNFNKLSLTSFFAPLAKRYGKENVSAGLLGGKAEIRGTGKSLREILATADGDIGIGMEGGQLSRLLLELAGMDILRSLGLILTDSDEPVPLQCVISHFKVESGIMRINGFLIDTDILSISAKGGINLKNETLDMQLDTHPKKPALLSLHSPIIIDGTLKSPHAGIDKVALAARGGAATALALLAPPAAIIAFIEPGLSEGGSCAAFIKRSEQEGATQAVK
jgi:uncharacterized protein involved in outer membrane biogenesis